MSAVWAWIDMSSLPPNAPPLLTSSVCTRSRSTPSTRRTLPLVVEDALALRVDEHPAFAVRRRLQRIAGCRVAVRASMPRAARRTSATHHRLGIAMHASGSRNRCSIRCVRYVSSMTWADSAKAFFDVAALELRLAEQVRAALRMDQRRARLERFAADRSPAPALRIRCRSARPPCGPAAACRRRRRR